jgi:hypothetical protein
LDALTSDSASNETGEKEEVMKLHIANKISRVFFAVVITFATIIAFQVLSSSEANAATCKVTIKELGGVIVGRGADRLLASEDAAMKCFERRARKEAGSPANLDEETGLAIIDQCINLRCEG